MLLQVLLLPLTVPLVVAVDSTSTEDSTVYEYFVSTADSQTVSVLWLVLLLL
jgi:ABC-type transport system involved in cytochrome c biogenesis permease component